LGDRLLHEGRGAQQLCATKRKERNPTSVAPHHGLGRRTREVKGERAGKLLAGPFVKNLVGQNVN